MYFSIPCISPSYIHEINIKQPTQLPCYLHSMHAPLYYSALMARENIERSQHFLQTLMGELGCISLIASCMPMLC